MTLTLTRDPRTIFDDAVALATAVIGRVGPHQLGNPTPCPEFDVRALLGHMVAGLRQVAGRPEDVGGDFAAAWLRAARAVEDAAPSASTLVGWLNEVTVHTWDLATATGQRPAWDPKVVGLAFDGIRFLPATDRGPCFADAVAVADDAPLIDRLVAWNGRRPVIVTPACGS